MLSLLIFSASHISTQLFHMLVEAWDSVQALKPDGRTSESCCIIWAPWEILVFNSMQSIALETIYEQKRTISYICNVIITVKNTQNCKIKGKNLSFWVFC